MEKKRVLVVDDEPVVRQSFRDLLEDFGYGVIVAENGKTALDLLKTEPVDIVLCDIRMPEMDGLELLHQCRITGVKLPVIVISGLGDLDLAVDALRQGASDYLSKPVEKPQILQHAIESALETYRLEQENARYQTQLQHMVLERTMDLEQSNLNLQTTNSRLQNLVGAAKTLSGRTSVDGFCSHVLELFCKFNSATAAQLFRVTGNSLQLMHHLGSLANSSPETIHLSDYPDLAAVVSGGDPLMKKGLALRQVPLFCSDPSSFSAEGLADTVSQLVYPLVIQEGHVCGVIVLYAELPREFTEQDREMGGILASFGSEILKGLMVAEDRQKQDRTYRALFERSNDAIFILDGASGAVEKANEAALQLLDRPLSDIVGAPFVSFIEDSSAALLGKVSERNEHRNQGIVNFRMPTGKGSAARLRSVYIDAATTVQIATDITEKLTIETQLKRVQKLDAVGQMAGGVAHDFNNILGILLGNLSLLERQPDLSETSKKRAQTAIKSATRAAELTKRMMGFSRQQAARVDLVSVNELIDSMGELINHTLTPEIELEKRLDPGLWLTEIDRTDFESVLVNLVVNARDAMAGGGRLVIETTNIRLGEDYCKKNPDVRAGDYIKLTISDTGIGIDEAVRDHLFEPFFTTKERGKGTGLGLAMVYGFVKRSGGHIKVYSELGYGTTFHLYFPYSAGERQNQMLAANSESASVESFEQKNVPSIEQLAENKGGNKASGRGGESILICDDETEQLELVQAFLRPLGYRVLVANGPERALQILDTHPEVDVLITDVIMPGALNGYQLAEQVHAKWPKVKILLTSGYTDRYGSQQRYAHLNRHLLAKPYSVDDLVKRLDSILSVSSHPNESHGAIQANAESINLGLPLPPELIWSDDYRVGLDIIDDDHQILVNWINEFRQMIRQDKSRDALMDKVGAFVDLVIKHFRREETLMKACHYSGYLNHRQLHRLLIRQVEEMRGRMQLGKLAPVVMLSFLKEWLMDHLTGVDKELTPYFLANAETISSVAEKLNQGNNLRL